MLAIYFPGFLLPSDDGSLQLGHCSLIWHFRRFSPCCFYLLVWLQSDIRQLLFSCVQAFQVWNEQCQKYHIGLKAKEERGSLIRENNYQYCLRNIQYLMTKSSMKASIHNLKAYLMEFEHTPHLHHLFKRGWYILDFWATHLK